MDTHTYDQDLVDQLRAGNVRPFVGSGLSNAVRHAVSGERLFPSWSEFILRVADAVEQRHRTEPGYAAMLREAAQLSDGVDVWLALLDAAKRKLGGQAWTQALEGAFYKEKEEAEPSSLELARLVWGLGSGTIITTNYDRSLWWAGPSKCRELCRSNNRAIGRAIAGNAAQPHVLYLHGCITFANELIVTRSDYDRAYKEKKSPAALEAIRAIATSGKSLLFVGHGLRDFELMDLLMDVQEIFGEGNAKHFAIVSEKESERVKKMPVYQIPYGSRQELPRILRELAALGRGDTLGNQSPVNHPLATPSSSVSVAKSGSTPVPAGSIGMRQLFDDYALGEMRESGLVKSTINGYEKAVERWCEFEQQETRRHDTGRTFFFIHEIDAKLLTRFYRWLLGKNSDELARTSARFVARVLRTAVRENLISQAPKGAVGKPKPYVKKRPERLLQMEEIERMWRAIPEAPWPRWDSQRKKPTWSVKQYWQGAFIFYLTYGLKTQELISCETAYLAICWRNLQMHSPEEASDENGYGWLSFVPQHQKRTNSEFVRLPLTKHAWIAARRLAPPTPKLDQQVFDSPNSSTSFRGTWRKTFAKVVSDWPGGSITPTDLRNVALHNLEHRSGGLSRYVTGTHHSRSLTSDVPGPAGTWIPLSQKLKDCYANFNLYPFFREIED